MLKKIIFGVLLGLALPSFAAEKTNLYVLDKQTNKLYKAEYNTKKQMYIPAEVSISKMPPHKETKIDIIEDDIIGSNNQFRAPAYDEEGYTATYSERAIIEAKNFKDIFQVYVCHIYKSCDHVSGIVTQFDRGVGSFWNDNPGVIKTKTTLKNNKKHGISEMYYPNGYLGERSNFKDGVENGPSTYYYTDGKLKWKGNYKDGKLDGPDQNFDENGTLRLETVYVDGAHSGPVKLYTKNGTLKITGQLEKRNVYDGESYDEIFDGVEYDENGKEVRKIPQGSIFNIRYDDIRL